MTPQPPVYLVSSCLAGLCTRYDGRCKTYPDCVERLKDVLWLPVCPEQLGGLPTPREAADIVGGNGYDVLNGNARVLTKSGTDLTRQFIQGAQQVLQIAKAQNIRKAFLKARSPSCGLNNITGVTAALLLQSNIDITEF